MIANIYTAAKDINNPSQLKELLEETSVLHIFEPLFDRFENWIDVFKFIIYAYSAESTYIQTGDDWAETRRIIGNAAGLEHSLQFDEIVNLKIEEVWKVVDKYLSHQSAREFKHLMALRATYERMISSLFSADIDYDQQAKNTEHAQKIWDRIGEYEQAVRQKYGEAFVKVHKETKEEINKKKKSTGLSLENSEFITN